MRADARGFQKGGNTKIDFKKEFKQFYSAPCRVVEVDVPVMNFLIVDGSGDPNISPQYIQAIQALYSVSYTLKFMLKQAEQPVDFAVMPLEGLWWVDDMSQFSQDDKGAWQWTAMIMQPELVTVELFDAAVKQVEKKKDLPALEKLRLAAFQEGPAVQILHIGPYAAEGPNIKLLHEYILNSGYKLKGKHHEIYLGNPDRTTPEKLKTIIRQPFER